MRAQDAAILASMLLLAGALGAIVSINLRRRFDINAVLGIAFTVVSVVAVTNLLLVADRVKHNTERIDQRTDCLTGVIETLEIRANALSDTYFQSADRDAQMVALVEELRLGVVVNPVILNQVQASLQKSTDAKKNLAEVYRANPLPPTC